MSDPIIGAVLTELTLILDQLIRREVQLITGVGKKIKRLESEFKSIRAVLGDAGKRQVKEQAVQIWLEKLNDVAYEADDVLFEWITAMRKAEIEGLEENKSQSSSSPAKKVYSFVTLPCLGFNKITLRRDIALRINKINEKLADIAEEKDRYNFTAVTGDDELSGYERPKTSSYVDLSKVEGRDSDKNAIIRKLLSGNSKKDQGLNVVSVVGMGGMGKTTLAQVVYNSEPVDSNFDKRVWVCVSDPFDEVRVAKAILEEIEGIAPNLFELETVTRKIRHHLEKKKFLLVLDDVWTKDFARWEHIFGTLGSGACGSSVLVTTRIETVAKVMGSKYTHRLGKLSDQDSWALFKTIAFFERSDEEFARFEYVGRRIADKCKGRPLTVKTIGSLMRFKSSLADWENVLSSEFWVLEEAEKLFPPLMLSYYDLPPGMKHCFSFCALFPKDYVIEANNLVQLWMAQGYLESNENVEVEVLGQEYLQRLAMRSFFEILKMDKDGKRILSVKMHDMVHDFAQYLAKNECRVIEYNNSSDLERKIRLSEKKARHLTVVRGEDKDFPSVPSVDRLITLWVQSFFDSPPIVSQLDRIDPDLFLCLSCIRALDLSRNRIGELPKEIGSLIKLKYLNLSHNPFWELPQSLCDLFNLQTLKLISCDHLRKLPREIKKLVNLRHLEIDCTDNLKTLPKGISKMKSLQTLTKFIIVKGNDTTDPSCGVDDLNNLENLRGCLKIEGLGFVTDANEAKKANLHKMINLTDLHLDFSHSIRNVDQHKVVLEALEVHQNLQSLKISSYGGTEFPDWMMKLTNLRTLVLQDCKNCSNLPSLGKLPSLVTLQLEGLNSMKSLGLDFLGIQARSGSGALSAFPKLKKLKISKMESWEEWDLSCKDESFEIMPRLKCLKISNCNKLKALPPFLVRKTPNLKLKARNCTLLSNVTVGSWGGVKQDFTDSEFLKNVMSFN
ncbi:Putative disease resistance RPP13-like protein 1 [Striga hermonthica]|uniref:Disease resistance RPP13-like protein 1 n=1 Tax=Striga hermonthica TaxID=68872 RepID=A0A9N7RIP7_STRHE|nr:Putative disease resistance RPP13-like protein 1 [Striga hermonthica]